MENRIRIHCFGDSVTEGMAMDGHHIAEYGKHSYPSHLLTMLTDQGYAVEVKNYGHGGEMVADIAARCGAFACYTSEEIVIPADNEWVSLGQRHWENGKAVGTKLWLASGETPEEDACVYFTQMSHDTNPVFIDGIEYEMKVEKPLNFIRRKNPVGKETVIPRGAYLFTGNHRAGDVHIVYAGINDHGGLTLKRFLRSMQGCMAVNGGRCIILGATHALWEKWNDVPGETPDDKYEVYRRACMQTLGVHFIDLYDEFSRHGVDIALAQGCFADLSEEQLTQMRQKLAQHILPAEFVYDKQSEGNVHLSSEGYRVVASLVQERMKRLGYI